VLSKHDETNGGCRLRRLALVLIMAASGQVPAGQAVAATPGRTNPQITLRVYDYAVSRSVLSQAEAEATVILGYAGLNAVWFDCPRSAEEFENYPDCQRPTGPADFVVKILTKAETELFPKRHEASGQALDCPKNEGGCSAYVFYSDVQELAMAGDVPEFRLLGHVFAHEIGHLLLGRKSHSQTGIMRAEWGDREMQTIARGCLFFTERQSNRMREAVLAREASGQPLEANARRPRFLLGSPGGHEPFQSGNRRGQW
jgi:hypothetical protein